MLHYNQLGFRGDGTKRVVLVRGGDRAVPWRLLDGAGRTVARGDTKPYGLDALSGDHVHRIDIEPPLAAGRYDLRVDGAASQSFTVDPHIFRPLARAALNFFYQARAGRPIEARFAGGAAWARAAGHQHEVVGCFTGPDERKTAWPGCPGTFDVTGGWYDAGDHGKYVVNGGIALWTLLNAWEVAGGHPPFVDGTALSPDAGNGANDLLDEARWELRFLLAMQVPASTRMALPVGKQDAGPLRLTDVDAGGMAFHKVADRNWTPLPTAPADDREDRLLYPPSTAATLNLAATAAQGARIWRTSDPAFARRCLEAAERAYAAALRHPDIYAPEAFSGSGGYGDDDTSDELYWATAELYATTGRPALLAALVRMRAQRPAPTTEPNWGSTGLLGTLTLAVAAGIPAQERAAARRTIVALAHAFASEEPRTGYHVPYATMQYPWGSNGAMLNRGIILAMASRFARDPALRDAAMDTLDYVLGRNPLGRSYVSGFGSNPMRHPHHRFWAAQLDARFPPPPPGALSGGPNSVSLVDPVSARLKGRCAPQRCWVDDARAYAVNEVAINWNAPLVWMATWADADAGAE